MRLYHGSLEIVNQPQIMLSDRPLDFGRGFYTTSDKLQARRWVHLRMSQQNASVGYINIYEYTKDPAFLFHRFRTANSSWVDFVHKNRTEVNFDYDYDIVAGPVANDNVYLSFNLYESGIIGKTELIRRLKVFRLTDQFLFHTERSLKTLQFIGYKEVNL